MVLTIIRIEWEVGNIIQDHWGHCVNEMADLCMSMIDPERESQRERERERCTCIQFVQPLFHFDI